MGRVGWDRANVPTVENLQLLEMGSLGSKVVKRRKEKLFCAERDAFVSLAEPISTCVCATQVLAGAEWKKLCTKGSFGFA